MLLGVALQINTNPETPGTVLAAVIFLGTVIITGLLAAVRTLYKDNKAKELAIQATQEANTKQQADLLRESLKVLIDASNRIKESDELMERTWVLVHQMMGQRLTGEQLTEISLLLRDLRTLKSGG